MSFFHFGIKKYNFSGNTIDKMLISFLYRLEAKERKKEKQKQLREERETLGPPPPKKSKEGEIERSLRGTCKGRAE